MATSKPSAPLNAEPSRPDELESQDPKPKSYVDAVREEPAEVAKEITNNTSTPNVVNGTNGASQDQYTNGSATGSGQGATILRIVQTHSDIRKSPGRNESNGDSLNGAEQIDQEKRPDIERQESKHEYSATVRIR
jgi:hypothetical protein